MFEIKKPVKSSEFSVESDETKSKEKSRPRSWKIFDVVKEGERFVVDARFCEGGQEVGRISHSYPLDLSEKEIEAEVKKLCQTFFLDREQAVVEKVREEENKEARKKIDKLSGTEGKI